MCIGMSEPFELLSATHKKAATGLPEVNYDAAHETVPFSFNSAQLTESLGEQHSPGPPPSLYFGNQTSPSFATVSEEECYYRRGIYFMFHGAGDFARAKRQFSRTLFLNPTRVRKLVLYLVATGMSLHSWRLSFSGRWRSSS